MFILASALVSIVLAQSDLVPLKDAQWNALQQIWIAMRCANTNICPNATTFPQGAPCPMLPPAMWTDRLRCSRGDVVLLDLEGTNVPNAKLRGGSLSPALSALSGLTLFLAGSYSSSAQAFDPQPFPDAILSMPNLTSFGCSGCNLRGTIPSDIGTRLTRLDAFHVHINALSGTVPPSLANANDFVRLYDNNLSGPLPWRRAPRRCEFMRSIEHNCFDNGTCVPPCCDWNMTFCQPTTTTTTTTTSTMIPSTSPSSTTAILISTSTAISSSTAFENTTLAEILGATTTNSLTTAAAVNVTGAAAPAESTSVGLIAGLVGGAAALLLLIGAVECVVRRRSRKATPKAEALSVEISSAPHSTTSSVASQYQSVNIQAPQDRVYEEGRIAM